MTTTHTRTRVEHAYGWKPSLPDFRNIPADTSGLTILDERDPREEMSDPYDQGNLGSCTGNAVAAAFEYDLSLDGEDFMPSRLMIYFGEREIYGTIEYDSGAYGRDGFRVLRKQGVASEEDWPYDIAKFRERPPEIAYTAAADHRIGQYKHPGLNMALSAEERQRSLMAVLSNQQTVAFGFSVFESFESLDVERSGIVPLPSAKEKLLGGHEVLLVGYITYKGTLYALVRNSWGTEWGLGGYCLMPWQMILDREITDDFRTIYRPQGQ